MNLSPQEARARFAAARVGRLATADAEGQPHAVAIVFAVAGDRILHAVDHKPKRTAELRRLRNIRENQRVSVLVDHYEDAWESLWWARADGVARIVEDDAERREAVRLLAEKYVQYRSRPPSGAVVAIEVSRWSGWAYR